MQIQNVIKKYLKKIEESNWSNEENWSLFENHITFYSNPTLFDFVAQNKTDFQSKNGVEKISKYLKRNYTEMLSLKSREDLKKAVDEYPFNTVAEAQEALESYKVIEKSEFRFRITD